MNFGVNMKKTILSAFFPFGIIVILLLSSCSGNSNTPATSTTTDIGYVTQVTLITSIEATGSITPRQVATVAWTTSGTIGSVEASLGQEVVDDQVLMTLDPASLSDNQKLSLLKLDEMTSSAAIAQAQQDVLDAQSALDTAKYARLNLDYTDQSLIDNAHAEYVLAEAQYETAQAKYNTAVGAAWSSTYEVNVAKAYTEMYTAKDALDTAEYIYDLYNSKSSDQTYAEYDNAIVLAEVKLAQAQNYLAAITGGEVPADATGSNLMSFYEARNGADSLNLRAPFAGTVAAIYDEPGILVANNHPSVKVIDRSKLYIMISLDESEIMQVSPGMSGEVSVDVLPDLALTAHIVSIEPEGQVSNNVVYYDVIMELDQADASIPLNASASVSIQIGEPSNQTLVPATAIQSDTSGEFVQLISGGAYQRVDVVSGTIMSDDTVVVTGNLKVGDQVLLILTVSAAEQTTNGLFGGLFGGEGGRQENFTPPTGGGDPIPGDDGILPDDGGSIQVP
jgi:multidrug efflux pump subunit AcrA (membrane-fusion protein)